MRGVAVVLSFVWGCTLVEAGKKKTPEVSGEEGALFPYIHQDFSRTPRWRTRILTGWENYLGDAVPKTWPALFQEPTFRLEIQKSQVLGRLDVRTYEVKVGEVKGGVRTLTEKCLNLTQYALQGQDVVAHGTMEIGEESIRIPRLLVEGWVDIVSEVPVTWDKIVASGIRYLYRPV